MRTSLIRDESIAALSFDLSEQARFAAVRAALGAGEVADVGARLKAITKQAEIAKEEQVTRHTKAHEELGRALTALTEARSVADRQNDVVAAEKLIQTKVDKTLEGGKSYTEAGRQLINERRQRISAIRSALAESERLQAERSRIETPEFMERLRVQQELLNQTELSMYASRGRAKVANEEFARAQVRDASLSSYLTLLDSGEQVGLQNGLCPLCALAQEQQQFMDAIHAAREILKEKRPEAAEASSVLSAASQEARQIESRLSTLTEELRQMEAQRSQVRENFEELTVRFRDLNIGTPGETGEATQALLRLQEDLSLIEQATSVVETSGAQDRVASSISKVDQLRAHVEEEATRLTLAERAVERAIQIETAAKLVANEIISEQVDTVLPLLKELYQRLRPHADWREIEIDIAGQVRASLNFSVGDGKNPQFLFSSGQRRAAGLAFLLALHLSRPWCGLETLLLDDPVQHVDDYRALNLVEVLSTVRRSGRQVIIAVEDGALADILCRRLRSSLKENGKRFDLGTDLDGSATIIEEKEVAALSRTVFEIAEAS